MLNFLNSVDSTLNHLRVAQNLTQLTDILNTCIKSIDNDWKQFISTKQIITELSKRLESFHTQKMERMKEKGTTETFLDVFEVPLLELIQQSKNNLFRDNENKEYLKNDWKEKHKDFSLIEFRKRLLNSLKNNEKYIFKIYSHTESFSFLFSLNFYDPLLKIYPGVKFTSIHDDICMENAYSIYLKGVPDSGIHNEWALDYFLSAVFSVPLEITIQLNRVSETIAADGISELSELLAKLYKISKMQVQHQMGVGYTGNFSYTNQSVLLNNIVELLEETIKRLRNGITNGIWQVVFKISFSEHETQKWILNLVQGIWKSVEGNPISFVEKYWANLWTTEELATFMGFPLEEKPGIRVFPIISFGINQSKPETQNQIKLGRIMYLEGGIEKRFALPLNYLNRHIFISGITGSGKTTTLKIILEQLWKLYKIPFVVIEPAKTEYKEFIDSLGGMFLDVISNGIGINFFEPPGKINPIVHADFLKAILLSTFNLMPFHSSVFEYALYDLYENSKYEKNLDGLIAAIWNRVKQFKFTETTEGEVIAALLSRLENLKRGYKRRIFYPDNQSILDFEHPLVINLSGITADFEKSLIMNLLLMYIYENNLIKGKLKNVKLKLDHITVIEEAHRILSKNAVSFAQITMGEAQKSGTEMMESFFMNLLAEIRAYGEGIIVAEQLPSKISEDVIKQTGTKIVHKLVDKTDRELIGNSMGLSEIQMNNLLFLETGEAVVFSYNTPTPIKIKIELNEN